MYTMPTQRKRVYVKSATRRGPNLPRAGIQGANRSARTYRKRKVVIPRNPSNQLDYPGVGEALGSAAGSLFGPAGAALGAGLGKGAHHMFKAITGFGDYQVAENSLIQGGLSPPEIVNAVNHAGFIVRHREYLGDITASTDFTVHTYPINPGMDETFPWLSQIANSFEQYTMRGLVFEFKSLSSDSILSSATSTALGSVVMATSYDSLDAAFVSKNQMENYDFANSEKPSSSFYHPVECKKSMGTTLDCLYIRDSTPPANSDKRMYDLGLFQLATSGMQSATGVIGELWCTYEIELYKAKVGKVQSYADHFELFTGISGSTPLGTARSKSSTSNLGCVINGLELQFPDKVVGKKVMINWHVAGAAGATVSPTFTLTNCSGLTIFDAPSAGIITQINATGYMSMQFALQVDKINAKLIWSTCTVPTGTLVSDLFVLQIPDDIE